MHSTDLSLKFLDKLLVVFVPHMLQIFGATKVIVIQNLVDIGSFVWVLLQTKFHQMIEFIASVGYFFDLHT